MSYSERGFGARIENAQTLLTHLENFGDYSPSSEDLSMERLSELIDLAGRYEELAITTIDDYAKAVTAREKLFRKEPESFLNLLTTINSAVRSGFGRNSEEEETVAAMVRKIRGVRLTKLPKNPDDAATISQSESSYGSLVNGLLGFIIVFEKYGDTYKPVNPSIQLTALKALHAKMEKANKEVSSTLGIQSNTRSIRVRTFESLHDLCQRIKYGVRSQYTASSNQYKLIKNLVA